MKIKRNILITLLVTYSIMTSNVFAQDLSTLPENERNGKLIEIAKSVYKAPRLKNFYREFGTPTITEMRTKTLSEQERNKIKEDTNKNNIWHGANNNQKFYIVYFHYDMNKERFDQDYAAKVYIWENTGQPFAIGLGNMIMLPVKDGQIPNANTPPDSVEYYTITYSADVPGIDSLPKKCKFGDLITISLKTVTTDPDGDGWVTEQGYNFDPEKDLTGGQIMSESHTASYNADTRTIQIMVTGNMKVNVQRYTEEYEDTIY